MMRWIGALLLGVAVVAAVETPAVADWPTVEVPNVLLMEFPMAESTIRKAGLKIDQIVRVPHEKVAGIVVGQGPGPGTRVMVGYQMRLYVSKGPK
jgi:beta-lactam-binding protein with PASTA domain